MYNIREYKEEDYPSLIECILTYLKESGVPMTEEATLKSIDDNIDNSSVLVLEYEGKIVGVFNYLVLPDVWSGALYTYKLNWLVDKNHRGNGKLLLEKVIENSKKQGSTEMRMTLPKPIKGYEACHTEYRKAI